MSEDKTISRKILRYNPAIKTTRKTILSHYDYYVICFGAEKEEIHMIRWKLYQKIRNSNNQCKC